MPLKSSHHMAISAFYVQKIQHNSSSGHILWFYSIVLKSKSVKNPT